MEKAHGAWLKVLHFSGAITPVSDNNLINLSVNNREILNGYENNCGCTLWNDIAKN